jgi:NADH dehydrogenase [ubiquinone] 1 alpha subcomplex assembly factor 7
MEICLYDREDGYFASGAVRPGERGDFVTSPEVSPWFGRFLGRWAVEAAPANDAILVEVGAGAGSLLEPLVEEVGDRFSEVFAVEVSKAAREAIAERVPSATVVSSITELPRGRTAVVIANEVLDNMPFKLVERSQEGWLEWLVDASKDSLGFVAVPADGNVSEWSDSFLKNVPVGSVMSAQISVGRWLAGLAGQFDSVKACFVDYGASTAELGHRDRAGVVRSYRGHLTGLDFLAHPGDTDITTDVNITSLESRSYALGMTYRTSDQAAFLLRMGIDGVVTNLRERELALAADGDVMGQLAVRSDATNIGALMDPAGLGGFCVVELAFRR